MFRHWCRDAKYTWKEMYNEKKNERERHFVVIGSGERSENVRSVVACVQKVLIYGVS